MWIRKQLDPSSQKPWRDSLDEKLDWIRCVDVCRSGGVEVGRIVAEVKVSPSRGDHWLMLGDAVISLSG